MIAGISQAVIVGPSTDRLYRTNLAQVEAGKKERLEALKRETAQKYKDAEEAGQGQFRLHETRNTLDALKEEVCVCLCVHSIKKGAQLLVNYRLARRRVSDSTVLYVPLYFLSQRR